MNNTTKKLLVFAVLGIPVSCALYAFIIGSGIGINGGSVFALALMWVPGAAALISKLVIDHSVRGLGWRLSLRGVRCMAAAYLIPLGLCLAVYSLAWMTGLGGHAPHTPVQNLTMATLGVLVSMLAAAGEEIGWRGFLLTELRRLYPGRTVSVIIGIVWFFYHAPLIVFSNYNNGNVPVSLVCFFGMVMGFTFIADLICVRAHSFWPAVLLHASHNVFVQSIFDTATVNGPYTHFFTSEFGIGLAIGYIVVCLLLYKRSQ